MINVFLQVLRPARRFCPEALSFLQALLLSALPKANRSNGVAQLAIVSLLHTTSLLSVGVSLQEFCAYKASLHKNHEFFGHMHLLDLGGVICILHYVLIAACSTAHRL